MIKNINTKRPIIYIIAGEPSGDFLGAKLMQAIKLKTGGDVVFAGVGGENMVGQGLKSLFPMEEITLMGLIELIPHAGKLLRLMQITAEEISRINPDAIVTIDSPGFCLGVLNRIYRRDIPRIHYVAPSVWAWRQGRLKKFVGKTDHMLCLLPFEPPWFQRAGLPATFVGHPVLEKPIDQLDGLFFRKQNAISEEDILLGVFPGSRMGELNHHLPVFKKTISLLAKRYVNLKIVIPAITATAFRIRKEISDWALPVSVVTGESERYCAMAACNYALAASGTISVELARLGVPSIIAYHTNPITEFIARRLAKVKYVSLCNILVDKEVVPERIQRFCRPDILKKDLCYLIENPSIASAQVKAVSHIIKKLSPSNGSPSITAAEVVLGQIKYNT